MHFMVSSLKIVKIAADSYHFMLQGQSRQIDEIIDGPKLIAMLGRESLQDLNGQPLTVANVMESVDALDGLAAVGGGKTTADTTLTADNKLSVWRVFRTGIGRTKDPQIRRYDPRCTHPLATRTPPHRCRPNYPIFCIQTRSDQSKLSALHTSL